MSTIAEEVEVLRGARSATFKDLLTHRAFARLLAAMSVSSFGDWVGFVAVTSIVASLGGGTASLAVSGVMIARTLPAFLFGPIAGTLVDRLDRKRLMIVADLARGALYVSMVFLRELWAIYLLSFTIECLSLLWGPARDASLPNLVPRRQLANANSLVLLSSYATLPIGGAAFTAVTAVSIWMGGRIPALASQPESLALVLDAGTFLFSALMVAGISIRTQPSHATERLDLSRVWRDTLDGISFLREESIAAAMTGGIVVAFGAVGAVLALGPMNHGSCEHCDTPVKPSCHGTGGSGDHHAAGRHGPPSGERAPSCPCPAHKPCGILHADQTALSASLAPRASFSGGGVTLVVAVDAPSFSLRGDFRYPGGRASPSPHRPPLYLATHSLLI